MTRWWALPTGRLVQLGGAVVFGVFFLVAAVLRFSGVGDDVTVRVAGGMAYAFLAFLVVALVMSRSRSRLRARHVTADMLAGEQALIAQVGSPVAVDVADAAPPPRGELWAVAADVSGPSGSVPVTVTLRRERGDWVVDHWHPVTGPA